MKKPATTECACRIGMAELAAAMQLGSGFVPEDWIAADQIAPDWRGQPSVSVQEAARLVGERNLGLKRHEMEQTGYREYLATRAAERAEAVREAAVGAQKRVLRKSPPQRAFTNPDGSGSGPIIEGLVDPLVADEARRAGINAGEEAGARFDDRQREMTFESWISRWSTSIERTLRGLKAAA